MKWHRLYKESIMDSEYQKLIRLIISYKQAPEGSGYEKEYMKEIKSILKPFFAKGDNSDLKENIRRIITTFFDLDEHRNPTIPTSDDVGELDEIEYSSEVVDRIWELVK